MRLVPAGCARGRARDAPLDGLAQAETSRASARWERLTQFGMSPVVSEGKGTVKIIRWFMVCVAVGALGALAAATANGEARALPITELDGADTADIRPWLAEQQAKHGVAFAEQARQAMAAQSASQAASGRPYGMRPLGRRQGGAYEQLIDDFEGQVIDNQKWFWIIDSDLPPTRFGEYFWALSQCTSKPRKSGDIQSFWAIGGGRDGSKRKCGDLYPSGASSEAALLLDLRFWDPTSTSQLELNYDIWLNTRIMPDPVTNVVEDGLFAVLCIPEGGEPCRRQVVLEAQFGQSVNWFDHPTVIDLTNACDHYDPSKCYQLAGREVIIKFVFKSERVVSGMEAPQTFQDGVFIDNVVLVSSSEPGPVLDPPLPTWTPVPGRTVTVPTPGEPTASPTLDLETDTPGPSETPEPTETPEGPATPGDPPTDTPEPSASPTMGEITDTATPEPTETRAPTETSTTAPPPPPQSVFLPVGYR